MSKKIKITILLLLLAGIFGSLFYLTKGTDLQDSDDINFDSPTDTELEETKRHKDELSEDESDDTDPNRTQTDSKSAVTPVISYHGQPSNGSDFEINAYVPEVVESNGACTVKMTRGDQQIEKSKVALPDAQNTSCGLIVVARDKLQAGKWSVVLSYDSPSSVGDSDSIAVTIK